ncbi:hypothetical protein FNV43_RR09597 [Rhamnella rubrinervis]|uniref:NusG-like N-terminal domain-containing protein n=1 Tax=Rhamnella rubrinervis TaxID=2594499 RepID=A0A8K0MJY3_9ROSA|nr:hypothetical protein FNV43_RR09597 [Rhamnella rubrinervis]
MTQGLQLWGLCHHFLFLHSSPPPSFTTHRTKLTPPLSISATLESTSTNQELTARERRRLRNERRESKAGSSWKEEVEEKLLKSPRRGSRLGLRSSTLIPLLVRVLNGGSSGFRVRGQETAELIARQLARNFPQMDFKVYAPAIQVKRKLKNGSYSVKPKPLFPGCVFLRCILNKEIHDFIRECNGVGGFVGSKVGNNKRQINKPRPVDEIDMEAIFRQAKEEQEKNEKAFEEEQRQETINSGMLNMDLNLDSSDPTKSTLDSKPKYQSKKPSDPLRSVSTRERATVGFTLFGKESLVDIDVNEIVADTK